MAFEEKSIHPKGKLGTFLGVYTPTVLTILGVIMYLRLGWVVGNVGLIKTLLIVVIANLITLITTFSFSAIATNTRVGVGGAYYIISRSLGLEFGGAIGIPLFLAQAFSVTLYAFGLAESFRLIWQGIPIQLAAFIIIILVAILAWRGASVALKAQIPLMIFIGISIIALAIGAFKGPSVKVFETVSTAPKDFWKVFAVFFPAVTGIMAGLGLSGDLRDPVRAIPHGALAATLTGFGIYLLIPVLLVKGAPSEALLQEPLIWTKIAPLGALLIMPGLWGAIFSSAVSSILGGPRTLQALARDELAPKSLANVSQRRHEPTFGLAITLAIALGAVFLGALNKVAVVISMFFLTVYGTVNIVAALETLSGDPSWRPRLNIHWAIYLTGGLCCFAVMMLINVKAAFLAIVIEIALWLIFARQERRAAWGDARRGIYESLIRASLVRLSRRPMTARNWRPHILVFVESAERRLDLIRFGIWFSQGRGVVTICELVVGDLLTEDISILDREREIQQSLLKEGFIAFGEVDVVQDVISGITHVAQANGMAGLDSNTVMLGWPKDIHRMTDFLQVIQRLDRLKKSTVIGRVQPGLIPQEREKLQIHIWWGGLQRNSDLMLLLAHLLTRNAPWRNAKIKILSIASNELMKANTENYLLKLIPEIRIHAEANVFIRPEGQNIIEIIHQRSKEADVVFLGLEVPKEKEELEQYAQRMLELSESLKTVFFVKNSSLFVGQLVQTTDQVSAPHPEIS